MGALMDWVITDIGVFSFNEWHLHVFVNRGERKKAKDGERKGYTVMNMGYDGYI
jgi:hypothetical protein